MSNLFDATNAFKDQLNAALPGSVERFTKLRIGEKVPTDPNDVPWVSLYRAKVDRSPRVLGTASLTRWESTVTFVLRAQQSHPENPENAESLLDTLVEAIFNAINADLQLGGTVEMINSIKDNYLFSETKSSELYFQMAEISVTAIMRA